MRKLEGFAFPFRQVPFTATVSLPGSDKDDVSIRKLHLRYVALEQEVIEIDLTGAACRWCFHLYARKDPRWIDTAGLVEGKRLSMLVPL